MTLGMNMRVGERELTATPVDVGTEFRVSRQLRAVFIPEQQALWLRWRPQPRPSFNPDLLEDLRIFGLWVLQNEGIIRVGEVEAPVQFSILASDTPGVFQLGGDLDLFQSLIDARDRAGLARYGRACIDVLYRNYIGYDLDLTTISCVQGQCLGGGFEAALASEVVVAERRARFGFPEILFNLFPGMGAYSFVARAVKQKVTEEILTSGQIYTADEMRDKGLIEIVADDGQGEAAVVALMQRRKSAHRALARVRRRIQRLTESELTDIVDIWVDAALRLNPRDLRLMQLLVARQSKLDGAGE